MRVYLDDKRQTPEGWHRVFWPEEAIELIKSGKVEVISLDHDLGDDQRGTGYDVLSWIEEQVFMSSEFKCPELLVHSANPAAKTRMLAAITQIEQIGHRCKLLLI